MQTETIVQNNDLLKARLYDYIVENQIVTEMGYLDENDLTEEQKFSLKKSKVSSNLINI